MQAEVVEALALFVRLVEFPVSGSPAWVAVAIPQPAALERWPRLPSAALPGSGRLANGRGLTREACRRSCLGELAELWSACDWGDAPTVRATARALGPEAIPPAMLNGFSLAQLSGREAWNADCAGFDWRPVPAAEDREIDWLPVRDLLGGGTAYAPADALLIGRREAGDEQAVAIADSNGCAAGPDPDAALLAALLELIERDAAALWWYGGHAVPRLAVSACLENAGLIAFLSGRTRRTALYDITCDIGVPVLAAVSSDPDGREVTIGFSAALDPALAAESAITELLQMEIALEQAQRLGSAAGPWQRWRDRVAMSVPPLSLGTSGGSLPQAQSGDGLALVLAACRASGIRLYALDLTRPEFRVPVVRALSPDLCPLKPRFGRHRLVAAAGSEAALLRAVPFCI